MSRTRLAIAGASTLAVAGGTFGIGCALSAPTPVKYSLRSLISKTKRNLLEEGSNFWDIKYKIYEKFVKPINQLKLSPDSAEGLKQWCQKAVTEETELEKKDSSNYSITFQLCTKPTRSEKILSSKKVLVADGFWEVKARSYNSNPGAYVIPTIGNNNQATAQQIERWCNEKVEEELEKETDPTDKIAEHWCAYD